MKRILLDCDGILAGFIGGVLDLVEEFTGVRHPLEAVDRFDFAAALALCPDHKRAVTLTISHRKGWWSGLPVLEGAIDGVRALRDVADVYIVTTPVELLPHVAARARDVAGDALWDPSLARDRLLGQARDRLLGQAPRRGGHARR